MASLLFPDAVWLGNRQRRAGHSQWRGAPNFKMNYSPKNTRGAEKPKKTGPPKVTVKVPISIYEVEVEVPQLPTIAMPEIDMRQQLDKVQEASMKAGVSCHSEPSKQSHTCCWFWWYG